MTEEQYKKLNECLNECFLRLQVVDPVFIENLRMLSYASDVIVDSFEERIENNSQQNNLTFEDVYLLAREIVRNINECYLEKFDKLIKSGSLAFYDDNQSENSNYTYIKSVKQDIIDIKRMFNYEDVGILVHEFMHSTNVGKDKTNNAHFLTEFLSIYFEEYCKKYLIEEKQVNLKEIVTNTRIVNFLHANRNFNHYCLVLLAYDKLGNITTNTPNEMKKILGITDNTFENECLDILKQLKNKEKLTFSNENVYNKMVNYFDRSYRYVIGTLLAYYALNYCKFEDIVKLNEKINTEEFSNMNVIKILETIGIKINREFLQKAIECIKSSIQDSKVMK